MYKVAVVGAGQLGSRHLQALSQIPLEIKIFVVDPSDASLGLSKERFEAMPRNTKILDIAYLKDVSNIDEIIDLCILACNSDVRKKVIEDIVAATTVKRLILEKTLFQKCCHYEEVGRLLKNKGIIAWVNCPMRIWPVYKFLKKDLIGSTILEINVKGSNWGMGTTLIHYIDLVCFLTGTTEYSIENSLLDSGFQESKRPGFIEFTGTATGITSNGTRFSISSFREGELPVKIEIITNERYVQFHEVQGILSVMQKVNDWDINTQYFEYPFQSKLTDIVAEEILVRGTSGLPSYQESAAIHIPIIESFLDHINHDKDNETDTCPVT